jgi:hypothetical protein
MADPQAQEAKVFRFPDLKTTKRVLMGPALGTPFDPFQRMFAYYGDGDVFSYPGWTANDMKAMFLGATASVPLSSRC